MAKSNVAPLTIANLAMLEKQMNTSSKKAIRRRASRLSLSKQSEMASEPGNDSDDEDVKSRRTSNRQGRDSCKIIN